MRLAPEVSLSLNLDLEACLVSLDEYEYQCGSFNPEIRRLNCSFSIFVMAWATWVRFLIHRGSSMAIKGLKVRSS